MAAAAFPREGVCPEDGVGLRFPGVSEPEEGIDGVLGDLCDGLAHRRECGVVGGGLDDIVKPDDREVVRDADALFGGGADGSHGEFV